MPAAAVIPAPIAYVNIVAVKKLVVGFLVGEAVVSSRAASVARVRARSFFVPTFLAVVRRSFTGSASRRVVY